MALFDLSGAGVVTFKSAPDFENPDDSDGDNVYQIIVSCSDGELSSDPGPIDITVTDGKFPQTGTGAFGGVYCFFNIFLHCFYTGPSVLRVLCPFLDVSRFF